MSDRKSVDKLEATAYEQFKFIQWHKEKYFLINELDSLVSWRDIIAYKWNFIKAVQWSRLLWKILRKSIGVGQSDIKSYGQAIAYGTRN